MIGAALGVASAIRAGLAFVELDTDDDPLIKGLNRAKARLAQWGAAVATAGATITAAGVGIVAPLTYLFKEAVDRASTISDLALQMNSSTEAVSKLAYAFEASGLKLEEFADIAKTLDLAISTAMDGNDDLAHSFAQLGLSAQQLAKLPLDERLTLVGERLDEVTLGSDRTKMAVKLLGGQGQKSLRLFANGAEDLKEFTAQAEQMGAVLGGDTVKAAKSVSDSFNQVMNAVKFAGLAIGEALLPNAARIKDFAGWVVRLAGNIRAWVKDNQSLVTVTVLVGAGLAALGGVVTGLGVSMTVASVAVHGLTRALGLLGVAGGFLITTAFTPLGAAILATAAAWTGLSVALYKNSPVIQDLAADIGEDLVGSFDELKVTGEEAFQGIFDALSSGDLAGAGEVAMAGLTAAWKQGLAGLQNQWASFRDFFLDSWSLISSTLEGIWSNMVAGFKTLFIDMLAKVLRAAATVADSLGLQSLPERLTATAANLDQTSKRIMTEASRADDERAQRLQDEIGGRAQARGDALVDASREVAAARKKLLDLVDVQADRNRRAGPLEAMGPPKPPDFEGASRMARGIFAATGNLAGVFGLGDTKADRQIRATGKVEDAVKDVGAKIDKLGPRFS